MERNIGREKNDSDVERGPPIDFYVLNMTTEARKGKSFLESKGRWICCTVYHGSHRIGFQKPVEPILEALKADLSPICNKGRCSVGH